ncbi:MAG: hypothetical protein ACOC95_09075 [Planctomycetota bacterium]
MDRTGVDTGVLLPGVSPECRKQYSPTEDILELRAAYPARFIPFCNIDPRAEGNSPAADLSRQLLYYRDRGCYRLVDDLSASSGYNALTRDPEVGPQFAATFADRLLMGTDTCSPTNEFQHAALLRRWRDEGKLTPEAFEAIAWGNANRVLGLGL